VADSTKARLQHALAEALRKQIGAGRVDPSGYVSTIEDNLVPGVTRELFWDEFSAGAGRELSDRGYGSGEGSRTVQPKMLAAHGSAVLAVNSFARWKDAPKYLAIAGATNFERLNFEQECPTGLPGTPPTLDLLAEGPFGIVGVESKCTEYFEPKAPLFSESYESLADDLKASPWFRLIPQIEAGRVRYEFLDVAQLIKHAIGLARAYDRSRPHAQLSLLYVFWEPEDALEFKECAAHRRELAALMAAVSNARVGFSATSYTTLWERWEAAIEPPWAREHASHLMARYRVAI